MGWRLAAAGLCLVLAACGDDTNSGNAAPAVQPLTPVVTTADFRASDGAAKCGDGEMMLNALCYPDPDRSLSASSVVFLKQPDGSLTATCLSGGANIRVFCVKR